MPLVKQPTLLQPLHSSDSFATLSEQGWGLSPYVQTSSHIVECDGNRACRRLAWEAAAGRFRPPNFWQKSQNFNGYFEILMIIQKQSSPVIPFWSVADRTLSVYRYLGFWGSGLQAVWFYVVLPHLSLPHRPALSWLLVPMPFIWSLLILVSNGWSRERTSGQGLTARREVCLCLCCSERRSVKHMGMHMYYVQCRCL